MIRCRPRIGRHRCAARDVRRARSPDLGASAQRSASVAVDELCQQDQRVLVIGGGPVGKADKTHATDRVSVVDLAAADIRYRAAAPMGLGRMHLNAVLLPDRTVFVSGGSLKQEDEPLARLQSELYDPDTDSWQLTATATVPRLYHSTALLLPTPASSPPAAIPRAEAQANRPDNSFKLRWVTADRFVELGLHPPDIRGPLAELLAGCRYSELTHELGFGVS